MTTTAPKSGRTTYHRDGTVTLWDCLTQSWVRSAAFSSDLLATLDSQERERVMRHTSTDGGAE